MTRRVSNTAAVEESIWTLDQASTRRSLLLCAIGAIAGLLIAGFGLFTAAGTHLAGLPPEDAATVNGTPILMSDYVAQLRSVYDASLSAATSAEKRKILDDMVREELYVQRGVEIGLTTDDTETRAALVGATEALTASDALTSQPDDVDLRRFFDRNRARYATEGMIEMGAYTAPSASQTTAAIQDLRAGRPLDAVIRTRQLKTTGVMDDGEEFYFAARIHLGAALFDVARKMKDKEVKGPFSSPAGPELLVMKHNHPPVPQAFEQVRARVLDDFIKDAAQRLQDGNQRFLRKRADIVTAPGLE